MRERGGASPHPPQPAWLQDVVDAAVVAVLLLAIAGWTILGH